MVPPEMASSRRLRNAQVRQQGWILHDSFLVREGRALDVDAHVDRLTTSSELPKAEIHPTYADLLRFAAASPGWTFPLVTIEAGRIGYALRLFEPAQLRTTVTLWTSDAPDMRTFPRLKGPDFSLQTSLRRRAEEHGAEEAIIIGQDGFLREGAYSSLVYWSDGALVISSSSRRLPSVTEAAVVRAAGSSGDRVAMRDFRPEEVRAADEVWTLSSLHGIRVVTRWDGKRMTNAGIAAEYRNRLQDMEQDVSTWLVS